MPAKRSRVTSLAGAAGAAALILEGWGQDNLREFFEEPARIAALLETSAFFGAATRFMLQIRGKARSEVPSEAVVAAADVAGAFFGLFAYPYLDARPHLLPFLRFKDSRLRWLGVTLVAVGTGVQVWAMRTLGAWYTPRVVVLEGHELIRNGPYRVLRHPAYTGVLATGLGYPAAFGSWAGAGVVAMLPFLKRRMDAEERLLGQQFGPSYEEMVSRTWRLIPGVY